MNYHKKTKKELVDMLLKEQNENTRLASMIPADPTPVNDFEMHIEGWTLRFDRDSCKVVKQK